MTDYVCLSKSCRRVSHGLRRRKGRCWYCGSRVKVVRESADLKEAVLGPTR